jgi:hypothetical protein
MMCIAAGEYSAQPFGTPKMPGEPKRVQPSRSRADTTGKTAT